MTTLELNSYEVAALRELLDRVLGDLSVEIADTDLKAFRDDLKEKRDCLNAIKNQLSD